MNVRNFSIARLALIAVVSAAAPNAGCIAAEQGPLYTESDYVYEVLPQGQLKLTIFSPKGIKPGEKRATIVFQGGVGTREPSYFAGRGMVAVRLQRRQWKDSDIRLVSLHSLQYSKSAMRWLRANAGRFGIDPNRIATLGGSATADIAMLTALTDSFDAPGDDLTISPKPNALVLYYPGAGRFERGNPRVDNGMRGVEDGAPAPASKGKAPNRAPNPGTPLDPEGELFVKVQHSPFEDLLKKSGNPPTIVFYGTADKLYPGGREFVRKAIELGVQIELYTADGQTHRLFDDPLWHDLVIYKADEFLASLGYLQGKPAVKISTGTKLALKRELP